MPGLNANQKEHSLNFFFFFECNKSVSLAFCNVCPWALQHSVGHLCCKPSFYAEHLAWRWCWKPSARPGCVPGPGDHLSRAQHNHFPLGSGGRQPAGSLLPSSACSQSWPSICSELPACPVQGAQPGQVLTLGGRGVNLYPPVPLPCLQPQGGWRGWKHLHIPVSWVQGVLSALPALSKAWAVAPRCPPAPTSLFLGVWWQPGKPGTSGSRTTSVGDG